MLRHPQPAGRHAAVVRQLMIEFDGVLSRLAVEAEVVAAEAELRGQVPAGSLEEMLHRLAAHRLRERAGANPGRRSSAAPSQ